MAGDYDGTSFIALDSARAGDGTTDATTTPVSAAIENILESGHRYTRRRTSSRLCFSPWQARGAERPLTSAAWTCRWMAWVDLTPADTTIRIEALGSGVGCDEEGTAGEVQVRVEFIGFAGDTQGVVADAFDAWAEGGDPYTIEVDLTDKIEAPMSGIVRVWVRSGAEGATAVASAGTVQTNENASLELPVALVGAVTARRFVRIASADGDPVVDPLHVDLNDNLAINYRGGYGASFDYSVEIIEASYLQVTTWVLEIDVDPDVEEGLWVVKHPVEMEPQTPVKGQHVVAHPKRSDAIYERGRIAAMGPSGRDAPSTAAPWPAGYYPQWGVVDGTGGTLDEMSVRIDGAPCRVDVRMMLASIVEGGGEWRGYWEDIARQTIDWTLNASLYQLAEDGHTWSSPDVDILHATTTRDLTDTVSYYTTPWVRWPLLQQMFWAHRAGSSPSSDWQYGFREGQLFEADLDLFIPVQMSLDVPAGVDIALPTRIKIDVDALTAGDFDDLPSGAVLSPSAQSATRLLCVASQATVYPGYP